MKPLQGSETERRKLKEGTKDNNILSDEGSLIIDQRIILQKYNNCVGGLTWRSIDVTPNIFHVLNVPDDFTGLVAPVDSDPHVGLTSGSRGSTISQQRVGGIFWT